jgi:hypothetical protein
LEFGSKEKLTIILVARIFIKFTKLFKEKCV